MDNVVEKLNKLKDELYNIHEPKITDGDFVKLVKLTGVNDELYETLILIHSNYKAEIQAIKNMQFQMLTKVVDVNIETILKQRDAIKVLSDYMAIRKSNENSGMKTLLNVIKPLLFFILVLFGLYLLDAPAADSAVKSVKSLLHIGD